MSRMIASSGAATPQMLCQGCTGGDAKGPMGKNRASRAMRAGVLAADQGRRGTMSG